MYVYLLITKALYVFGWLDTVANIFSGKYDHGEQEVKINNNKLCAIVKGICSSRF